VTDRAPVPEERWAELREDMVARQLAVRGIRDPRVLRAMRAVPRHRFIPEPQEGTAYGDHPVPIGEGQTISQPYIVAEMTALALTAAPAPRTVLDVGTGSGYQAAILAELGLDVVSIERLPALADRAWKTLASAGYERVQVRTGDGTLGWAEGGPYGAIVVAAAAPEVPPALVAQLRVGGVLVVPVGSRSLQELLVVRRNERGVERESAGRCVFVPLLGEQGWREKG
jgi:protein-L-isoaspartate(D-aspartate) O-methyltransferase